MLGLSISTRGGWWLKNLKKILIWAFALIMFVASCWAVINAMNILAAGDSWTVEADGSGLINIMKAANSSSGEERVAYCLDPDTDYASEYPNYVNAGVAAMAGVQALLRRAYPVLTAQQMGIVYLNDATLTEREAYEATQIAIWEIVTDGDYEMSDVLIGRTFALAEELLASDVTINEGSWITVDTSQAIRQQSNSARDSYGPIRISVDTGSVRLDDAIRTANLTFLAPTERDWVLSSGSSASGSEVTYVKADNTSYYVNYPRSSVGAISFSLSHALANSNLLNNMEQIESIYGAGFNQLLGVVEDMPKVMFATIELDGIVGLNLNKTWLCAEISECQSYYSTPINFDIYEVTPDGHVLVDTINTIFDDSMSVNVSQAISNTAALKSYTEYIVIERTLVEAVPSSDDIIPFFSISGSTSGAVGKYKISGGVLEVAEIGEAYYAGIRFMTNVGGSYETINARNKKANMMEITLKKSVYMHSDFPAYLLPTSMVTNYYIYASTDNGATWVQAYGPIAMYDYVSMAGDDYTFFMNPGTKYRLIEDTTAYHQAVGSCPTVHNERTARSFGNNYSSLGNVRTLTVDDYLDPTSINDSRNGLDYTMSSSGEYAGVEWDAGFGDGVELGINNRFTRRGSMGHSCFGAPTWLRRVKLQKHAIGDNPNGWGQDYLFKYEVTGSYIDDGQVSLSPEGEVTFFEDNGTGDYPSSVTYTIYEDPISFCADKISESVVESMVTDGVRATTTKTVWSYVDYRVVNNIGNSYDDGYSSVVYDYAPVDCSSGTITGSWSSDRPTLGGYVTRITITVDDIRNSNITIHADNGFREDVVVEYSTLSNQGGVALILKYGYDGHTVVASNLDGTKFKIYSADGSFVRDWTLGVAERGVFGDVGGTSDYYVSPVLPAGEYYLQEVESVAGYAVDVQAKYYFTVEVIDSASALSITQVRKNGVVGANDNLGKAILNAPTYDLEVFKFRRKDLSDTLAGSRMELYFKTDVDEEPAYGNENLRGYERVREFGVVKPGTTIEGLPYGWYKLVEVQPPGGFVGPLPEVAVGFSVYVGPSSTATNNYSGARLYISNDWVGLKSPDVPSTGSFGGGASSGGVKIDEGMVAAVLFGICAAMVLAIAMFVGKKLTIEIEENGSVRFKKLNRHNDRNVVV